MTDRLQYRRKPYSDTQIAYFAGIMDGEGCFFIGNFSRNKITGTPYYQTLLTVSNTDKRLIDWLFNTFGGMVSKYTRKQLPKNSRKEVHRWQASGERLKHLCELILPYIVCKKRETEIMLEMRQTYDSRHFTDHNLDQATLSVRKRLFDEIRTLHTRSGSIINPKY